MSKFKEQSGGGMYCFYRNCKNTFYKSKDTVKFFRFPKDENRCRTWIKACGREDVLRSDIPFNSAQFYNNYRICSIHFEDDMYNNPFEKLHLLHTAKPTPIIEATLESDPLAIKPSDNLSLFDGAMDNIEFILESDDDDDSTNPNIVAIDIEDSEDDVKPVVNNEQVLNDPDAELEANEIIDLDELDSDSQEVKEEIEIGEANIQLLHNEKEDVLLLPQKDIICEKLSIINQDDTHKQIHCYVPGCESIYEDSKNEAEVYWFSVPVDQNLRKIWDIFIDRTDKRLGEEHLICHQHFADADIVYKTTDPDDDDDNMAPCRKLSLRQGAVPCMKFHEECCVPNCGTKTGKMYCFPVIRTSDYHLWLYMIRNSKLKNLKLKEVLRHRVCIIHFDSSCFDDDLTLNKVAVPTLNLPVSFPTVFSTVNPKVETSTVGESSTVKPTHQSTGVNSNQTNNIILVCAHGECPNRSDTGKTLFMFPTDPNRCIAWLEACGRTNLISTPTATLKTMSKLRLGVCEDHFSFQQFGDTKNVIKPDAIPVPHSEFRRSIAFLSQDGKHVAGNSKNTSILIKPVITSTNSGTPNRIGKPFTGSCSYKDCQNRSKHNVTFFRFPIEDPERFDKWLEACGLSKPTMPALEFIYKNQNICSKHFKDDMFETPTKLKDCAIPVSYTHINERTVTELKPILEKKLTVNIQDNKTSKQLSTPINIQEQQNDDVYANDMCCAVENCSSIYNASFGGKEENHKFPNPTEDLARFNIWLQLIANPKLKELSQKEIYTKYMVCHRHFETYYYHRRYYKKGGKSGVLDPLHEEAVPTKNLTADVRWFYTSDYYTTRLPNQFKKLTDLLEIGSVEWKEETCPDDVETEDKTTCILEKDRIRFPGMGHSLYIGDRANKRKLPYGVYNYFKTGYGLNSDIEFGEKIKIHTAIIIDDDDECEREVLQQLLDKRRKLS